MGKKHSKVGLIGLANENIILLSPIPKLNIFFGILMMTSAILKNGLPRMKGISDCSDMSRTMKLVGNTSFSTFTGTSSAIPNGLLHDLSTT